MSDNGASEEGSSTEPPPPSQQNDDPQKTANDENEKFTILSNPVQQNHRLKNQLPRSRFAIDRFEETTIDLPDSPTTVRGPPRSRFAPRKSLQRPLEDQREESQIQQGTHIARAKKGKNKIIREQRKAREIYREALHNTRDTITLVAVLISTFTYFAGISPPGGVHQDGPLIGTAVAAKRTAFRVFSVCNNVALFTSLCVVLVLVSIIPFKRKALMRMMAIAHKVIWVAVSFMATAYVAAGLVIMRPPSFPLGRGSDWTVAFLLSLCAGSLGSVFVGLGILLVKHRLVKRKWRKQKNIVRGRSRAREKDVWDYSEEDDDSSIISDMAISRERGYHSF